MDLAETEATEVAAECIAAIEWQTNFARNPNKDGISAGDIIAAVQHQHVRRLCALSKQ